LRIFDKARRGARVFVTVIVLTLAAAAGWLIWVHYFTAPWTRDGQVLAYVVDVTPEISGRVVALYVGDNQVVSRGEALFEIDPLDYQIAVASAQAMVNSNVADLENKKAEAARRGRLTTLTTSAEEQQTYKSLADIATATLAASISQLNQAKVNLERTTVRSPVNGYVTNLQLREGNYATKGIRSLSLLDSDSFWIAGYFEETKIAGIKVGDPAYALLMAFPDPVRGHVESIARGINTPNTQAGGQGLAMVDPVFTWVRLAQRIPVRIHIDEVPPTVVIAAGMTATVTVGKAGGPSIGPGSTRGLISRLFTQAGGR